MKRVLLCLSVFYTLCIALPLFAQPGVLDPSFGNAGRVTLGGLMVADMQVQPDQHIVVAGSRFGADNDIALVRLLPDGDPDNSFGVLGLVNRDLFGNNDRVTSLAIQPDGKILVGGISDAPFVARFNANGSVDMAFGTNGYVFMPHPVLFSVENWVVGVLPDGKIILAGSDYLPLDLDGGDYIVFGMLPNGAFDPAFGTAGEVTIDGGIADQIEGLVVQSDGKFILLGTSEVLVGEFGGTQLNATLIRCGTEGGLDRQFGDTGVVYIRPDAAASYVKANKIIPDAEGRIMICGANDIFGVAGIDLFVARCAADGTLDASFDTDGILNVDAAIAPGEPSSIAWNPQGGFLVNATESPIPIFYDTMVLGFDANGAFDAYFGNAGTVVLDLGTDYDRARAIALQSDGKILSCSYESILGGCDVVRLGAQGPVGIPEVRSVVSS